MNGLVPPTRTELSFAPIYEQIMAMGLILRNADRPPVPGRAVGCGRAKLALDAIDRPADGGRCQHVSVLRQRYETLAAVDPAARTHDLADA